MWNLTHAEVEHLAAEGWSMASLEGCVTCGASSVWRDPLGRARHPWCGESGSA